MKKLLAALFIVFLAATAYAADTKGSALDATGGVDAANDKLYVIDATGPSSKADTVYTVVAAGAAAYFDGSSDAAQGIRFYDGNSHYTALAPGDSTANLTFTFPTAYPAASGYLMVMSDAGVISTTNSISGTFDIGDSVASGHAVTMDANGVLQTAFTNLLPDAADGAALGSATYEWSDLFLADGAVINLGADQDVTFTHVADTGVLINSSRQIQFGDSGTYINQSADGVLNIASDTELKFLINDEDLKLTKTGSNGITVGTNTGVTDISTALNFAATGQISGRVPVVSDADGKTLSGTDLYGSMQLATGAGTWTIPDVDSAAGTGQCFCVYATGAYEIIIAGDAEDKIRLNGTLGAAGGDITNNTAEAAGDFICLMLTDFATDVAHWTTLGYKGTWTVVP